MSEWKECKLGEAPLSIIDGDRGKNYPNQNEFKNSGYCLFLSTKNVRLTGFDFADCQFISKEKDVILRKGKLNKYDLVLTTRGTVGNIGYYSEDVNYENIRINSGMVIIRPQIEQLVPKFNFYIFRYLQKDFLTFTTGSAQPQLPIRDLNEIEIKLPPLPEQKAIASILSSLDDKIDLLHRQNTTLEKMAETLFRQWFLEEAKEEWEEKSLSDYISVKHGYAFKGDLITAEPTPLKLVTPGNFNIGGGFKHGRFKYYASDSFPESYIFKPDDLVVTMTDLSVDGDTLGYSALVPESFGNEKYLHNQRVGKVEFKTDIGKFFIYHLMKTEDYQWYILSGASGTSIRHTSPTSIGSYKFKLPPKEKMMEFENYFKDMHEKIKKNQIQIRTLTSMRDNLLPKLMSGEVRVKI